MASIIQCTLFLRNSYGLLKYMSTFTIYLDLKFRAIAVPNSTLSTLVSWISLTMRRLPELCKVTFCFLLITKYKPELWLINYNLKLQQGTVTNKKITTYINWLQITMQITFFNKISAMTMYVQQSLGQDFAESVNINYLNFKVLVSACWLIKVFHKISNQELRKFFVTRNF